VPSWPGETLFLFPPTHSLMQVFHTMTLLGAELSQSV
jgi:hypothetical protein